MRALRFGIFFAAVLLGAIGQGADAQTDPPFSDTAGTVFDIIQVSDASTFACIEARGTGSRQIWDKRVNGEPVVNAHLFDARFTDGTNIEIAINPEFSAPDANAQAESFAFALGQLPTTLRRGIERFSVHGGDEGFHAGTGQIVVYSERADQRRGYNHLEESLFHEAVHASLDAQHRLAPGWIDAQHRDGRFLTGYGQRSPEREDLAETALFVFAILHHPERFPPVDTQDTLNAVPARVAYIKEILPPDSPLTYQVAEPIACEG